VRGSQPTGRRRNKTATNSPSRHPAGFYLPKVSLSSHQRTILSGKSCHRNRGFIRAATVSSFLSSEKNQRNRPYSVADEPPRAFKDMGGLQTPHHLPLEAHMAASQLAGLVPETRHNGRNSPKFADAGEPVFSLISVGHAFGPHTTQVSESLKGELSCRTFPGYEAKP
jgi:hypothetical protein